MAAFYMRRLWRGRQAQSQHDVADIRPRGAGVDEVAGRLERRAAVGSGETTRRRRSRHPARAARSRRRRSRPRPRWCRRARPCRPRARRTPDGRAMHCAAASARCWQRPPRPGCAGRRTTGSPPQTSRSAWPIASSWQKRRAAASASPRDAPRSGVPRAPARAPRAGSHRAHPRGCRPGVSRHPGAASRPLPITAGSSRGTSEIARPSTLEPANSPGSRPPLTSDSSRRLALRLSMSRPWCRRLLCRAVCRSASDTPGAGISSSADAPPDTMQQHAAARRRRGGEREQRLAGGEAALVRQRMARFEALHARAPAELARRCRRPGPRPGRVAAARRGHRPRPASSTTPPCRSRPR